MHEQFSLFDMSRCAQAPARKLKRRMHSELHYPNGARVESTQDRYGMFWLVKIEHKDRVAFTTVRDAPEQGNAGIARLIKSLEH